MLKLNASFSKKVPVPGIECSSHGYHATVEVELPDGLNQEQLQARIHQTFALVRDSVEAELRSEQSAPATGTQPAAQNRGGQTNGNGQQKVTPKQIQFLTNLGVRHQIDLKGLNALAVQAFKVSDITGLTVRQASKFIDSFDEIVQGRQAA